MTKYWTPPTFFTQNFFTKITQNGLKWILNITLKTVKFFLFLTPPPLTVKNFTVFLNIFFEGFPKERVKKKKIMEFSI